MSQVIYDHEELEYDSDTGRFYFMRDNRVYYPAITPLPEVPQVTDDESCSSSDDDDDVTEYEWFVPFTPEQEKHQKLPEAPKKISARLNNDFENLSIRRKLF